MGRTLMNEDNFKLQARRTHEIIELREIQHGSKTTHPSKYKAEKACSQSKTTTHTGYIRTET